MNYKTQNPYTNFLIDLAARAADLVKHGISEVHEKTPHDYVTNIDVEVEKFCISEIKKHYPAFGIVSEEENADKELTDNCFIIDPIDGTNNFLNGLPYWCIQLAAMAGGKLVGSAIFIPSVNEMYYAALGEGAFLNGNKIKVSSKKFDDCLYFFETQVIHRGRDKILNEYAKQNGYFRKIGSIGVVSAQVAAGRYGGGIMISTATPYWDALPGKFLCDEAGGKTYYDHSKCLICANTPEMLTFLKDGFDKHFIPK